MGSRPVDATAVIAAAGSGERLGAGGPKALVPLAGRPMVEWSIEAFRACELVRAIVIAAPPGHERRLREGRADAARGGGGPPAGAVEGGGPPADATEGSGAPPPAGAELRVVAGGETRARSVANALAAVETDLVAIHDAARPLVTAELIEGVIGALLADEGAAGAIAATPVVDTIKRAGGGDGGEPGPAEGERAPLGVYMTHKGARTVAETVDRRHLWAAQTPQVFRTGALRAALEAAGEEAAAATDESMLVEAAGGRVLIHPSSPRNLKVTTPFDLRVAELLAGRPTSA